MLERNKAPEVSDITDLSLPQYEEVMLKDGRRVYYIETDITDLMVVDFIIPSENQDAEKANAAALLADMFDKSNEMYTEDEMADITDQIALEMNVYATRHDFTIRMSFMREHFATVADIMGLMLSRNILKEDEFNALKARAINTAEIQSDMAEYAVSRLLLKRVGGTFLPERIFTEADALRKITVEDIRRVYSRLSGKDMSIVIIGKMQPQDWDKLNERKHYTEEFLQRSIPRQTFTLNKDSDYTPTVEYNNGEVQTNIDACLKLPVDYRHTDYDALDFLATILADSATSSRMNQNIREEKGYTYGVNGYLQPLDTESLLHFYTSCNSDKTDFVIQEMEYEIRRIASEPVSEDELQQAKKTFFARTAKSIDTPVSLIGPLREQMLYPGRFESRIKRIQNLTPKELLSLARKYFDADKLIVAIITGTEK